MSRTLEQSAAGVTSGKLPMPPEQLALPLVRPPRLSTRPFRTELTIEQNSLFVANRYQGNFFVRESPAEHPITGETVISRMTVGKGDPTDRARGVLRQVHQDAYYKVLALWGSQGYALGKLRGKYYGLVQCSAYELVKAIGGDDSSKKYRRTKGLLRDLAAIPIVLEQVYTEQGKTNREEFTLFQGVTWSEREVEADGSPCAVERSQVEVMLSAYVTKNFAAQRSKVLLGGPYDALGAKGPGRRSEIARQLYPYLDEKLTEQETFEASLESLSERFAHPRCAYRSKRKEKFETAVRALNGLPILESKFTLRVELVAVPTDYVLVAERMASPRR
jgi:hypothetical protein